MSSRDRPREPNIAQPGHAMFERNVGHQAARGKEVRVTISDGRELVGFWAGLDEGYVQICTTEDQELELVKRAAVISFKETRRYFLDLEGDRIPSYQVKRIQDRCINFWLKMFNRFGDKGRERPF